MPAGSTRGIFEEGYNYFSDLKELLNQGYIMYWDNFAMAPYLYNAEKKIFWTFDTPESVALKIHYVDPYNLRGLMFWEITGDDL